MSLLTPCARSLYALFPRSQKIQVASWIYQKRLSFSLFSLYAFFSFFLLSAHRKKKEEKDQTQQFFTGASVLCERPFSRAFWVQRLRRSPRILSAGRPASCNKAITEKNLFFFVTPQKLVGAVFYGPSGVDRRTKKNVLARYKLAHGCSAARQITLFEWRNRDDWLIRATAHTEWALRRRRRAHMYPGIPGRPTG